MTTKGSEAFTLTDNSIGVRYTPTTPANWSVVPTTVLSGLDTLASNLTNDLNKFEKVSKNIRSFPYSLSYSGGALSSITYTTSGSTSIVKTFNYTAGLLTSIVLSGNLPTELAGITTKTLSYTAGNLTSISYS
jgi:hypothetical protein